MGDFSKILIANRGEIACRIIKTAKMMGYDTVAVFSEADRDALHVELADEAVCIGPAAVTESYLNISSIIEAARRTGADAIHPGYGFLSENADFASKCNDSNITFVGPSAVAIDVMGNKAEAKRRMIAANVPCIPGYEERDQSDSRFVDAATKIGFPVMVKAAAGGGGRGMRLVENNDQLLRALEGARSEAKNAFGSDELILEKAVVNARHIEIQIFADSQGNTVHLGERDCSIQRRHQKVIEEAPSPVVSDELREKMGAAAVAAAKAINYVGAGTVEFLLAEDGSFYFLEMNTRLQVEHPVTELITGYDLVEWQLRIARGERLPELQENINLSGHAIEARLYAEDPYKNFLPRVGKLLKWIPSEGEGLRTDHGLKDGFEITPHYDAMIAKVIAYGETREDARRRLIRSLNKTVDLGLTTNRQFLIDCLKNETFAKGLATTDFIDKEFPKKRRKKPPLQIRHKILAAALTLHEKRFKSNSLTNNWCSSPISPPKVKLLIDEEPHEFQIELLSTNRYAIDYDTDISIVEILNEDGVNYRISIEEQHLSCQIVHEENCLHICADGLQFSASDITLLSANAASQSADGAVVAPMNGKLLAIEVSEGERVKPGQLITTLEAMKMEHEITSRVSGVVKKIHAKVDDQVASRTILVEIEPDQENAN
ncbi:acetyl/propionyl/methylcrotonyl-CoA carboxylase subunit alpha [Sneathiella glossodoripedis]|uniref:acetyl/propionyl/methylcrotonyl-CoA carboxylase subunit alpha n=1 Tax=Sneathiella glossodoripedis TaxID=418853 RepID=UPI00046F8B9E|nr:acetyl-CoA carboxylase biotin carboxylase subunit [Sneathiella glossodoripedis]